MQSSLNNVKIRLKLMIISKSVSIPVVRFVCIAPASGWCWFFFFFFFNCLKMGHIPLDILAKEDETKTKHMFTYIIKDDDS